MTDPTYSVSSADLSQWVLDTALTALEGCNRPPITTAYVAAGLAAWDDCCGSLIVAPERIFHSTTFPVEDTDEVICFEGHIAVQFVVILLRCIPVPDARGNPPSASAMQAAYTGLMQDAAVIANAFTADLPDESWERTAASQTFVGADGGCIGVETRFTLGIPQEEWLVCCAEPVPHVPGGPLCRPAASAVAFTPCDGITATNVQDAICQLADDPIYGSFVSTVDQSAALNTATPMTLSATLEANGITTATTGIVFAQDCTIDIQFSAQFHHRGGGGNGESVWVWLAVNGTAVPDSATRLRVLNNHYQVAAWDWLISVNGNDTVDIVWLTDNTQIVIEHVDAAPPIPAIPSLIVTVTPIKGLA